jgi:hypothetical protein
MMFSCFCCCCCCCRKRIEKRHICSFDHAYLCTHVCVFPLGIWSRRWKKKRLRIDKKKCIGCKMVCFVFCLGPLAGDIYVQVGSGMTTGFIALVCGATAVLKKVKNKTGLCRGLYQIVFVGGVSLIIHSTI